MREAIFNTESAIDVAADMVEEIKRRALEAPRGRCRLCLHRTHAEPIQEMLIACVRGSYFRPHRYVSLRDKSYCIISGDLAVFFFNDEGQILRQLELGTLESGKPFLFRFAAHCWHMPVPRSQIVVYHEVQTGPFNKEADVVVPSWSLTEDDPAVKDFVEGLLS